MLDAAADEGRRTPDGDLLRGEAACSVVRRRAGVAENYDITRRARRRDLRRRWTSRPRPCAGQKQPRVRDFINSATAGDEPREPRRQRRSWSPCRNGPSQAASCRPTAHVSAGAEPDEVCYAPAPRTSAPARGRVVEAASIGGVDLPQVVEKPRASVHQPAEACIFQAGRPARDELDSKVTNNVKALCEYPEVAEVPHRLSLRQLRPRGDVLDARAARRVHAQGLAAVRRAGDAPGPRGVHRRSRVFDKKLNYVTPTSRAIATAGRDVRRAHDGARGADVPPLTVRRRRGARRTRWPPCAAAGCR